MEVVVVQSPFLQKEDRTRGNENYQRPRYQFEDFTRKEHVTHIKLILLLLRCRTGQKGEQAELVGQCPFPHQKVQPIFS